MQAPRPVYFPHRRPERLAKDSGSQVIGEPVTDGFNIFLSVFERASRAGVWVDTCEPLSPCHVGPYLGCVVRFE